MELQKQLNYMTKSELNSEIEYKDVINEIKKLVLYKENKKNRKNKRNLFSYLNHYCIITYLK